MPKKATSKKPAEETKEEQPIEGIIKVDNGFEVRKNGVVELYEGDEHSVLNICITRYRVL